jgi:hypothetical protein
LAGRGKYEYSQAGHHKQVSVINLHIPALITEVIAGVNAAFDLNHGFNIKA